MVPFLSKLVEKFLGARHIFYQHKSIPITYNLNADSDLTKNSIENPDSYDGWSLNWEMGRQLAGISGNGYTISFKYNDAGIRTEKDVTKDGITSKVKYHLVNNNVTYETDDTYRIYYTYDGAGQLISMNLSTKNTDNSWTTGVEYYYIRNAQGDITIIYPLKMDLKNKKSKAKLLLTVVLLPPYIKL